MSAGSPVNDEAIERTRRQIQSLVGEIAQLSKSEIEPREYYAAVLQRITTAMAAVGGAVWTRGEGQKLSLAHQINVSTTLLEPNKPETARHEKLLQYVAQQRGAQLIPPNSGNEEIGNPTAMLLVIAPLAVQGEVEGVLEIFQRNNVAPETQRGWMNFVDQMSELIAEWLKTRRLRSLSDRQSLWQQADQFARLVHDTLDLKETCYTIANEGRKLIGCDRVSVGVLRGKTCRIEAISGQDTLDNRSNIVHYLGKLATRALAAGESFWYDGETEELAPQLEEAVHQYVEESHVKTMAILPLRKPKVGDDQLAVLEGDEEARKREIIGALIVEQIEAESPRESLEPRVDLVYEHSARAVANALDHHNLFLMPLWKAIGHSKTMVALRNLPITISVGVGILALVAAMFLVPVPLTLKAKGVLQPVQKRQIYAPLSGEVDEILRFDGDQVEAGETLVRMTNPELDQQKARTLGDLAEATNQYEATVRQLNSSAAINPNDRLQYENKLPELKARMDGLERELLVINEKIAALDVKSPIAGRVVSWDVRKNLDKRPVEVGQVLMEVAKTDSDWELELHMPERRAGHVRRAAYGGAKDGDPKNLDVNFVLISETQSRAGKLYQIDRDTFTHDEEGACVRMKVRLAPDQTPPNPRPNAGLMASVSAGDCSLGYYLFHEVWEYLRINWLFF